ncbi:DUF2946 family protein [Hydrogenophilus islandicus]
MRTRTTAAAVALWWLLTALFPLISWQVEAAGRDADVCFAPVSFPLTSSPNASRHGAEHWGSADSLAACGYCLFAATHPGLVPTVTVDEAVRTISVAPVALPAQSNTPLHLSLLPPVRAPPC